MLYEEDEDDDELTEYEEWFNNNDCYFPLELRDRGIDSMELELFYHRVYKPVVADVSVALRKVMMDQHPSMSREIRPKIVERINKLTPNLAHEWITELYRLVYYDSNGFDLPSQYPCYDFWKTHNMLPNDKQQPYCDHLDEYDYLSDEEVLDLEDDDLIEDIQTHRYYARRRAAVYDALQLPVLKYYKNILNISAEAWVVYAGLVDYYFEEYRDRASNWNQFFKFGFPEELADLDVVAFNNLLMDTYSKKKYWIYKFSKDLEEEDRE